MKRPHSFFAAHIIYSINNFIDLEFEYYLRRGLSPVTIQKFEMDMQFRETIANQIKHHFGEKVLSIIGDDLDKFIGENIFETIHARIEQTGGSNENIVQKNPIK